MEITFLVLWKRDRERYKKQVDFWKEMHSITTFFVNELRYTCDEPFKILARYCSQSKVDIEKEYPHLEKGLSRWFVEKGWQGAEEYPQDVLLFLCGLGTTDLEGQLSHCTRFVRLFETKWQTAVEIAGKEGKLREKLWILAGVAAFLLLI